MRWSKEQLKQLKKQGIAVEDTFAVPPSVEPTKKPIAPRLNPQSKGLRYIKHHLQMVGIAFTTEHRFCPKRRFRFDVALPDKKLAIEYEGLFSAKSRHTTISGYVSDCEKYNLAQRLGWRVLRYTAKNYKAFPSDLAAIHQSV